LQKSAKIILGIDPGTLLMGYGIIEVNGNSVEMKMMQVLKLPAKKDNYQRLQLIHEKVAELIKKYKPHEFAIEAPFFGKNVQSMLKLGRAQGVAIAAAIHAGLPVTEYSPKKVKQSVTGNGNADKEQVWKMLRHLLSLKEEPHSFDATDALAVAVCHHFQTNTLLAGAGKGLKGWDEFIKKNPSRVNGLKVDKLKIS
jgi:crossover junction endodeoxyribonuclease RuvC